MHAYALEWLKDNLKPGTRALDVGCGSGYLCAAFYEMMERDGKVVGIDHIEDLVKLSRENLAKSYLPQLEDGSIQLVCGDGRKGFEEEGPYDVIHVGAAAAKVPDELIEQLAVGGKMIIPVGPESGHQEIQEFLKGEDGEMSMKALIGVRYVPLTSV